MKCLGASSSSLRDRPWGARPPLGQAQFPLPIGSGQAPQALAGHFRCRHCLLKGCTRCYRPVHPQSRYCSAECRREAQRWRRRQASRTWRASELGKDRRREQSRRYRRRIPLVVLPESFFAHESTVPTVPPVDPTPEPREGQRPASNFADFLLRWCARPGCYVVFAVRSALSPQRFCSCGCQRALRNVLDREARYRQRRRDGYRPVRRRSRPASTGPP
jgi:hypothetical protein